MEKPIYYPNKIDFMSNGIVAIYVDNIWVAAIQETDHPIYTQANSYLDFPSLRIEVTKLTLIYRNGEEVKEYAAISGFLDNEVSDRVLEVYKDWISTCRHDMYVVGFGYIEMSAEGVYSLADCVDDEGDPVTVPAAATGAEITVETSTDTFLIRVASNGSVPSIATRLGVPIYEDGTKIKLGFLPDKNGDARELIYFKAAINDVDQVLLHVTFYQYKCVYIPEVIPS